MAIHTHTHHRHRHYWMENTNDLFTSGPHLFAFEIIFPLFVVCAYFLILFEMYVPQWTKETWYFRFGHWKNSNMATFPIIISWYWIIFEYVLAMSNEEQKEKKVKYAMLLTWFVAVGFFVLFYDNSEAQIYVYFQYSQRAESLACQKLACLCEWSEVTTVFFSLLRAVYKKLTRLFVVLTFKISTVFEIPKINCLILWHPIFVG